ncbi:MAG: HAD hydrolase-like protein, partial [Candidatus Kapaibacteriota bacterium]
KTSIIGHVIAKHGIDPNTSWMIGDKEHDIHGAHAHAMKSIACLYGYGTMQDIEESKPTHICSSVKDLQILLTKLTMI